nr:unnamed protein product [Digitaria exilis]
MVMDTRSDTFRTASTAAPSTSLPGVEDMGGGRQYMKRRTESWDTSESGPRPRPTSPDACAGGPPALESLHPKTTPWNTLVPTASLSMARLAAGVAAAGDDGEGGGEPGVEDGVELAEAADAGLALEPDEVGGRVDGGREEVLRRADAELDEVLAPAGRQRGLARRGGAHAAASAAASHRGGDHRAGEAALHGAADELVAREVGVRAGKVEADGRRRHDDAVRREDREGEEEQEHQKLHGGGERRVPGALVRHVP